MITSQCFSICLECFIESHFFNLCNFQDGWATLEKKKRFDTKDRKTAIENLEKFQEEARVNRRGMWQYGHYDSDEEDVGPPVKKGAGKR